MEPEEVEERQQLSHLRCPGVLLGLTAFAHALVSTVSSQERPVKILTARGETVSAVLLHLATVFFYGLCN